MGLVGQPKRRLAGARRDLKDVLLAVVVVSNHVQDVKAFDLHVCKLLGPAFAQLQFQRALHDPLRQMTGAEAVGWEFLTGEVDKPDIATELPRFAQLQEDGGRQE